MLVRTYLVNFIMLVRNYLVNLIILVRTYLVLYTSTVVHTNYSAT